MDSIWDKDVQLPEFPQLEGDLRTDVLIIGGGLAGLLCAWNLKQSGVDCVLIEQNRLMQGVSGRTTAKVTSQHGLIYHKLLNRFGAEQAQLYWQANEDALAQYEELAQEADFDFYAPKQLFVCPVQQGKAGNGDGGLCPIGHSRPVGNQAAPAL